MVDGSRSGASFFDNQAMHAVVMNSFEWLSGCEHHKLVTSPIGKTAQSISPQFP